MKNKKLVAFDFDGVLVNSLDLWFEVNQRANPHLTKEQYSEMSYGNYFESFEGPNAKFEFNHDEESIGIYKNQVMKLQMPDSMKEVFSRLESQFLFAVVSSGSEVTIDKFLNKNNIRSYFSRILGNETHKSKTVKLSILMSEHNLQSQDILFVTDTLGDVIEAHGAGVKSIGVLWGLHDRETLEKGNPETVIDKPEDLEGAILKLL